MRLRGVNDWPDGNIQWNNGEAAMLEKIKFEMDRLDAEQGKGEVK